MGRNSYLAGVDGLRGVAVAGVLLYHAGVLPGGFLGVEVFFTISGFLITRLLVDEWARSGGINIQAFWSRRMRRLLPASLVVILTTLVYAESFLPDEVAGLRGSALAAVLWLSNWYAIVVQQSYFESVGRPPLLRHLWSLGIEAQFYLVWPLFLWLVLGYVRRHVLVLGVLGLAAGSAGLMAWLYQPGADPSRLYYGTDTRASGLLLGAALGLGGSAARRRFELIHPALVDAFGVLALAGLGLLTAWMSEFDPLLYRGCFAAVGMLTVITITAAIDRRGRLGPMMLGSAPLRWIGLRSYSIYLWHWPVFMLTRPQLDMAIDGWQAMLMRVVLVGGLAEVSYRWVELPLRQVKPVLSRRWAGAIGGLFVGVALLGTSVAAAKPPERPAYLPVDKVDTWVTSGPVEVTGAAAIAPEVASAGFLVADAPAAAPAPPAEARAAETETVSGAPEPEVAGPQRANGRMTAIGDSVMLGSINALQDAIAGIEVDAAINRQAAAAIDILRARKNAGVLGDVVIVHIGNNGTFSANQFDTMMDLLSSVARVIIVNVKVPRAWEGPNDAVLADGVQRYPNATLVDWRAASLGHPELFWDDGIHLRPEGAAAYAALIAAQAL